VRGEVDCDFVDCRESRLNRALFVFHSVTPLWNAFYAALVRIRVKSDPGCRELRARFGSWWPLREQIEITIRHLPNGPGLDLGAALFVDVLGEVLAIEAI
jgi:hypothetical protein